VGGDHGLELVASLWLSTPDAASFADLLTRLQVEDFSLTPEQGSPGH
jgi:hypothetical protein